MHDSSAQHDVCPLEPGARLRHIPRERLEACLSRANQISPRLFKQTGRVIDADEDATGAEPSQDPTAESPCTAADFDDAVVGPQGDLVQQPLRLVRKLQVLNVQSPRRVGALTEDIFL